MGGLQIKSSRVNTFVGNLLRKQNYVKVLVATFVCSIRTVLIALPEKIMVAVQERESRVECCRRKLLMSSRTEIFEGHTNTVKIRTLTQ